MFKFLRKDLKEIRCPSCNRLLLKYSFKGEVLRIQVKCPRCHTFSTFEKEVLPKDIDSE